MKAKHGQQPFERDERLEDTLIEQRRTPRRYEWMHSYNEKRNCEKYAQAKRKVEQRQSDS